MDCLKHLSIAASACIHRWAIAQQLVEPSSVSHALLSQSGDCRSRCLENSPAALHSQLQMMLVCNTLCKAASSASAA
jgi:hypothetical protein